MLGCAGRHSGTGSEQIVAQVVNGLPTIKRPAGTKRTARFGVAGPHDLRHDTRRRRTVMPRNYTQHQWQPKTAQMWQNAVQKAFQNLPPRNRNFYGRSFDF